MRRCTSVCSLLAIALVFSLVGDVFGQAYKAEVGYNDLVAEKGAAS